MKLAHRASIIVVALLLLVNALTRLQAVKAGKTLYQDAAQSLCLFGRCINMLNIKLRH